MSPTQTNSLAEAASRAHEAGINAKNTGQLNEAVSLLRRAVELQPISPIYHNDLGSALVAAGDIAEAAEEFRAAIRLQPNYPTALANLGNVLREMGQLDESEHWIR